MNEQEKALKLSALYKELAEIGTCFEASNVVGVWEKTDMSPNLVSALSKWRVAKPVKKIIDLTKCINTIDMEFTNCDEDWDVTGKLDGKFGHNHPYYKLNGGVFKHCRIRQNHIHYYNGEGNPLPDGLLVKLHFNNNTPLTYKSQNIIWGSFVRGFEVLEVLPEYKYEWEKE